MDRTEFRKLTSDLKKTGANTRLLDIILLNTNDSDDVGHVLGCFADDFHNDRLPLGRSKAVSTLKAVAATVATNSGALDVEYTPTLGIACGLKREVDSDKIVDDFFKPPKPVVERDATLDKFFNYRKRERAKT